MLRKVVNDLAQSHTVVLYVVQGGVWSVRLHTVRCMMLRMVNSMTLLMVKCMMLRMVKCMKLRMVKCMKLRMVKCMMLRTVNSHPLHDEWLQAAVQAARDVSHADTDDALLLRSSLQQPRQQGAAVARISDACRQADVVAAAA